MACLMRACIGWRRGAAGALPWNRWCSRFLETAVAMMSIAMAERRSESE